MDNLDHAMVAYGLPIGLAWIACGFLVWLALFVFESDPNAVGVPTGFEMAFTILREPHTFVFCLIVWPLILYVSIDQHLN